MGKIGKISSPASGALYRHLFGVLKGAELPVNSTADFPRIEISVIQEEQPLDKEGSVRQLTATIEAMSAMSQKDAVEMGEKAVKAIQEADDTFRGAVSGKFTIIGAFEAAVTMQEQEITTETQLQMYRVIHQISFIVECNLN